jgi:fructose-1,6-bisphosphatase/inositol monophosphatase family enzyme
MNAMSTDTTLDLVSPESLLELFHEIADAVHEQLATVTDWGPSGVRDSQYVADLVADEAVLTRLRAAGCGVLSEESGSENLDRPIVVVVDPLDGSTNASRGVPHFATSLCAVDASGPLVSLVAHLAGGPRWWAVRGGGAWRDGRRIERLGVPTWEQSVVAVSGRPPESPGWAQYRSFGASAIDLCFVADGTVDAFIDMSPSAHGVWDYSGAMLVCAEAGVDVRDAQGRELLVLDHAARRTPVAAPAGIMDRALDVRRRLPL